MKDTDSIRFFPLITSAKNPHEHVLYYDIDASTEAVIEYINIRFDALMGLLKILQSECITEEIMYAVQNASSLIIKEVTQLVRAFKTGHDIPLSPLPKMQ